MILSDAHVHTSFSTDSKANPTEVIETAIDKGLKFLTITDHEDFGFPNDEFKLNLSIDKYFDTLEKLKKKYAHKINLLIGLEIGLEADKPEVINSFIKSYPFNFVIGSMHLVDGCDIYYPSYYEGKETDEFINRYYDSILECLDLFSDFDVFGHVDYIIRYIPRREEYSVSKYKDKIEKVIEKIVKAGKGIELNTGGYGYGLNETNPGLEILKIYKEMGGKYITFGSDAHEPKDLAREFDKALLLAKKAGFNEYAVFENRAIKEVIKL